MLLLSMAVDCQITFSFLIFKSLLHSPGRTEMSNVDLADLELTEICLPIHFPSLGLKMYVTTLGPILSFPY